jgi:hypothetical protein
MNSADLKWRVQRLSKMSASEVRWRVEEQVRRRRWTTRQVKPDVPPGSWVSLSPAQGAPSWTSNPNPHFRAFPTAEIRQNLPSQVRQDIVAAAEEVLAGRWQVLGVTRHDMEDPDWFLDPITGRRAPQADYCFTVNHRSEEVTGNVKQVWELSRMHHLTVLAAAFSLTDDERFAERVAAHLRSWWTQNPFLSGVHWTSGIEAGVRLISWVWVRRLLDGWAGVADLFENNDAARAQIWWHQEYIAAFRSQGSSANNHVIAEVAGLLVGALAFDWFPESSRWSSEAASILERELKNNTFPSGVNRELAFDYHGFVAELAVVAAAEASWAGRPLSPDTWALLSRMFDVVGATVDVELRGSRQGDGDNGTALVLDPETGERWSSVLAIGAALFDPPPWWPKVEPTMTGTVLGTMAGRHPAIHSDQRPSSYADAGMTLLRSSPSDGDEIWCRCDAGPHGFLSIAAHAHADALGVEVRYDGVDILADPGTYCYHGEPQWRQYFRSTLAHNTIEVDGQDQSTSGGPFLWTRHAQSRLVGLDSDSEGSLTAWSAEHDGYQSLKPPLQHRRSVELQSRLRRIEIIDRLETSGRHSFRLALHLGPDLDAHLTGSEVELTWSKESTARRAILSLPQELTWSIFRGETDPVLGWYSSRFGEKQPTWALVGEGQSSGTGTETLKTVLQFDA